MTKKELLEDLKAMVRERDETHKFMDSLGVPRFNSDPVFELSTYGRVIELEYRLRTEPK